MTTTKLPYKSYIVHDNTYIWVGKNDALNDSLTFEYSLEKEWWAHIVNYAGSHIVIKNENDVLDTKILRDTALLAIKHSKAKNIKGSHSVMFCRCDQLYKKKGSKAGMVYHQGKTITISVNIKKQATRLQTIETNSCLQ
jgi:predicted ribosome quality control (RQC) complex YloA/Tae2 family protein